MSNAVFPTPAVTPGLMWDIVKKPMFDTTVQRATSGFERRIAHRQYPLYSFEVSYALLRSNSARGYTELQTLFGFCNARQGMFDSFLYSDPSDSTVTDAPLGTGDGSTTTYQLTRSYGGFLEPINNVNVFGNIKANGVIQSGSGYTVNAATGLVTFASAPAIGVVLTYTSSYYYRVRFENDEFHFNQFYKNYWELKKLSFVGSVINKV